MMEGCVGYFSPKATVNYIPATSVGFLSSFHVPLNLKIIINYIKICTYSFSVHFTSYHRNTQNQPHLPNSEE